MRIDSLNMYWRLKSQKGTDNIVPDFAPFEFDFRTDIQLITQKYNEQVRQYLETIYKAEYNIGYLQDANQIAKPYGTDFKRFIDQAIANKSQPVETIMEVGCGGCTLLEELQNQGFEVLGIDPSPIAVEAGKRKQITVIEDFFPSPLLTKKADVIFHSDVLEHVSDPVNFLHAQKKQLNPEGLILISIPDCNESIALGDASMIIHQHLNYFDNESLRLCVEAAGLEVVSIETARYGGSLYCCAKTTENQSFSPDVCAEKFDRFTETLDLACLHITNVFRETLKDKSVKTGFYVPLRALPYLAMMSHSSDFRFFDDTHHWYNSHFDGLDVTIENISDLHRQPVDQLFIMSLSFGEKIKEIVQEKVPSIKTIVTLKDLLSVNRLS